MEIGQVRSRLGPPQDYKPPTCTSQCEDDLFTPFLTQNISGDHLVAPLLNMDTSLRLKTRLPETNANRQNSPTSPDKNRPNSLQPAGSFSSIRPKHRPLQASDMSSGSKDRSPCLSNATKRNEPRTQRGWLPQLFSDARKKGNPFGGRPLFLVGQPLKKGGNRCH